MEYDYISCTILLIAFGFSYLSEYYPMKKMVYIWTFCAVISAGVFILVMLMRGSSMLDVALGLTVLAVAICLIEGKNKGRIGKLNAI